MGSSFTERLLVVYFLGLCIDSLLNTRLTQWMRGCIAVADSLPCPTVSFLGAWVTVIAFISFGFFFLVFFTELPITKVRAARIGTRPPWSSWHLYLPPSMKRASTKLLSQRLGSSIYFSDFTITWRPYCKVVYFTLLLERLP